jgi:GMP synthase (glutamine-hydrolysing)
LQAIFDTVPILGICYGAQFMASQGGGQVEPSEKREYGRARLGEVPAGDALFKDVPADSQVWMSHGDTIMQLPEGFELLASTESVEVAAFKRNGDMKPVYGIQFHPEVTHTEAGKTLLANFVHGICGCSDSWTPASFVSETVENLKKQLGDDRVVLGLSGGVDSTVAAALLQKAIGENLYCIFIDNGLLRKDEFQTVLDSYEHMGLQMIGVDAGDEFLGNLSGVSDPEEKRKVIGKTFIDVFDREAHKLENIKWLGQGTIYPDVIESTSVHGPSATIKSHHNVGGLPDKMDLEIVEPLRFLFKDEVRKVGKEMGLDPNIMNRHPFPGPGLAVRVLGEVTKEKVSILQEADAVFINGLKESGLYDEVWQALVVLLPIQSVGVMGDQRTYEYVVSLRAVTSVDGMTADWSHLPPEFLGKMSNDIINNIKGINRVVYDISSKPPATIEWE